MIFRQITNVTYELVETLITQTIVDNSVCHIYCQYDQTTCVIGIDLCRIVQSLP